MRVAYDVRLADCLAILVQLQYAATCSCVDVENEEGRKEWS
jgi:hypothetical protein